MINIFAFFQFFRKRISPGFQTLLYKELLRFWKVSLQTIAAPALSALLYLFVFSQVSKGRIVYESISYTTFLIPGLMMMSILQNAFANPSSSLIQSKIVGNLVFILLAPISHFEIFFAYMCAAIIRGVVVGFAVWLISNCFIVIIPDHPFFLFVFAVLSAGIMGSLGIISGLWSEKFDHLSAFQNFLIMPATFLSGVFYTFPSLPKLWQSILKWNPFLYAIDGFRYSFFSKSDVSPWYGLFIVFCVFLVLSTCTLKLLNNGYKLRS